MKLQWIISTCLVFSHLTYAQDYGSTQLDPFGANNPTRNTFNQDESSPPPVMTQLPQDGSNLPGQNPYDQSQFGKPDQFGPQRPNYRPNTYDINRNTIDGVGLIQKDA